MEASVATTKSISHTRSISLHSRPHPSIADVEEHLCRIRSSDATSTSSLCNKLTGLNDLYECLDNLLQLPIMHSCNSEDVFGTSIRLLDMCNTTKDAISQMRASVQDLESSFRRREVDVSNKLGSYLICMKKVNKMVSKFFVSFKKSQNRKGNETSVTSDLLKEVEQVSLTIFRSLFSSLSPRKETSNQNQNRWSMVFKTTRVQGSSEAQQMQIDLEALYKQKINLQDITKIQQTQKSLIALDMSMQQFEEDLDCLFRSLIKIRVSLLNI